MKAYGTKAMFAGIDGNRLITACGGQGGEAWVWNRTGHVHGTGEHRTMIQTP